MVSSLKCFLWIPVRVNIFRIFYSYIQHIFMRKYCVSGNEPGARDTRGQKKSFISSRECRWQRKMKQGNEIKYKVDAYFWKTGQGKPLWKDDSWTKYKCSEWISHGNIWGQIMPCRRTSWTVALREAYVWYIWAVVRSMA